MREPTFLWWPISTWIDLGQLVAFVAAGVWAYMLFVRTRQRFPRAILTHVITHRSLPNEKVLLRVTTRIANPGTILLSLRKGLIRVQHVLPLAERVRQAVDRGEDPVQVGESEVPWPELQTRTSTWEQGQFEIEPGEADEWTWDFVLDGDLETVQVYTYFKNVMKRGRDIGWGLTTLADLRPTSAASTAESIWGRFGKGAWELMANQMGKKPRPGRPTKQQPEKKPPRPQQPPKAPKEPKEPKGR